MSQDLKIFLEQNAALRAWDYMAAYAIDVSRGEIFLPSDEAIARFETNCGPEIAGLFLPELLQGHVNPVAFPSERRGRRVTSIGGLSVTGMWCGPRNSVFLLKGAPAQRTAAEGFLLTPEQRELLDLALGPPAEIPVRAEAQPRQQNTAPIQPPTEGGLVEIQGGALRQKIDTKQLLLGKQPKTRRGGGGKPSEKERAYIQAMRLRTLVGEEVAVPSAPPRLAPPTPEEKARREANLLDPPTAGNMAAIPESVLAECLPRGVELRDHQLSMIRRMLSQRGLIAVHSVGSGKTLPAAVCAACVLRVDPAARVLFISPKSLLLNFRRTLEASYAVVDWARVAFYTFEKFQADYEKGLIDGGGCLLIVDEAHRLRTRINDDDAYREHRRIEGIEPGKAAKAVLKCARKAGKVLLLTATPVVNDPCDFLNLAAMVRGDSVPLTRALFRRSLFSKEGQVRNPAEFRRSFGGIVSVYVRPRDDSYPTVEVHDVRIPMSDRYHQEYQRVEERTLNPLQRDVLGPNDLKPFYNGVRRTSNADVEGLNPKLDWVRRHLLRFNNRKMVIFSPFISLGVRQLEELVKDFDVKPRVGVVEGADSEEQRQAAIDAFNANRLQILLISVQAGGLGVNLLETRDVVIMHPGWNEVETEQALGRAVRFKSHDRLPPKERRVDVWKLLLVKPEGSPGEPAADEIVEAIAQRKSRLLEAFSTELVKVSVEGPERILPSRT